MQKKIAVINDLSGYGRCSLTVAIPVLSAMGHQCCTIPTAILSNHTEFPVYFFDDYTEKMNLDFPLTRSQRDFLGRRPRSGSSWRSFRN